MRKTFTHNLLHKDRRAAGFFLGRSVRSVITIAISRSSFGGSKNIFKLSSPNSALMLNLFWYYWTLSEDHEDILGFFETQVNMLRMKSILYFGAASLDPLSPLRTLLKYFSTLNPQVLGHTEANQATIELYKNHGQTNVTFRCNRPWHWTILIHFF